MNTVSCGNGHKHRTSQAAQRCCVGTHLKRLRAETKDWPKWMRR